MMQTFIKYSSDMDGHPSLTQKLAANLKSYGRNECRILLIGKAGTGKSSTGNTILGKHSFQTSLVKKSTKQCVKGTSTRRMGWQTLTVVDTPGLDPNSEILGEYGNLLGGFTQLLPQGPHVIILVFQIGRYTEEDELTVNYFLKVFGEKELFNQLIVLFTCKDLLEDDGIDIDSFVRNHTSPKMKRVIDSCRHYIAFENKASFEKKEADVERLFELIAKIMKTKECIIFKKRNEQKPREVLQQIKRWSQEEERRLQDWNQQFRGGNYPVGEGLFNTFMLWLFRQTFGRWQAVIET